MLERSIINRFVTKVGHAPDIPLGISEVEDSTNAALSEASTKAALSEASTKAALSEASTKSIATKNAVAAFTASLPRYSAQQLLASQVLLPPSPPPEREGEGE